MPDIPTTQLPRAMLSPDVWAQVFVRKSSEEPGFALDTTEISQWVSEIMIAAYTRGLKDGAQV